jgi:hypothetical protein
MMNPSQRREGKAALPVALRMDHSYLHFVPPLSQWASELQQPEPCRGGSAGRWQ